MTYTGLSSRRLKEMRENIFEAVFGHGSCASVMIIVGDDAIAGYGIVGVVMVDSDILMEMMRREHAKGLMPLVLTPERLGSSRRVRDAWAMMILLVELR